MNEFIKTEPSLKYYADDAVFRALNIPKHKTVWDVLEEKLYEYYDVPAIEYFNRQITRKEFRDSVIIWAKTFRAMGINENEIVPIYGPFFPDICAMTLALNAIGAIPYFLKLEISDKALFDETSDSKIAVVYDGMWENVRNVFMNDKFKKIIVATASDSMIQPKKQIVKYLNYLQQKKNKSLIPSSSKFVWLDEAKKISDYYTGEYKVDFKENRAAFITSSSGTSLNGLVKGTIATNEAALYQLYMADAADVNFYPRKRCLTNLPPTASTSLNCLFFLPLFKGMTVINEPRLNQYTFYNQIMHYKPSVALMTGSFWETFYRKVETELNNGKKIDLSFFDMPIIGGEGVNPKSLKWMDELRKKCNCSVPMFNGYGASELFSVVSVEKEGVYPTKKNERPVISVGIPYPGIEVGIFDENGNQLDSNQRGELWVKAPTMMKGYYGKEKLTDQTIVDGWLHTGDLFDRDEDGFLYIWGRKSNVIDLPNGKSIYLFDIENKICESKFVNDAVVNNLLLENGEFALAIHLLVNREENLKLIYNDINTRLNEYLPSGIVIGGYKIYKDELPVSPTTAKKDRKKMFNDLLNYKYYDGVEILNIDFVKNNDNYIIVSNHIKEKKKILKK